MIPVVFCQQLLLQQCGQVVRCIFTIPVSQQEAYFWMFCATEGMNLSAVSPIIETIVNVALLQNAAWCKWHGLQHDFPLASLLVPKTAYPNVLRICTSFDPHLLKPVQTNAHGRRAVSLFRTLGHQAQSEIERPPAIPTVVEGKDAFPWILDCSSSPCIALYFEGSQRKL